jgi:hypothetical protein
MTVKVVSIAWLCLMLLAPRPALAEDARLPYHDLCLIQKAQMEMCRLHPNLTLVLQLRSTNPAISYSNITASIAAKSGRIPVPIGPEGVFSVPVREDLLAENPWINLNQPRGTMELSWHAGLAPTLVRQMTNAIHYGTLMRAVRDCGEVQEAMRQFFPNAPRLTVAGLRLTFPDSAVAPTVVIHAKDGNRHLVADAVGQLTIPLDGDLMAEDPLMTLTANPAVVEIATRTSEGGP